jgi:hypothetical protein
MVGDFTDYAARQQAVSGQHELNNQAATYALKSIEKENDFNDNLYKVSLEGVEFVKSVGEAKIKEAIIKHKKIKQQTYPKRDMKDKTELKDQADNKMNNNKADDKKDMKNVDEKSKNNSGETQKVQIAVPGSIVDEKTPLVINGEKK